MAEVVYTIVEHDGGWAYKLGAVFSETFPTRREAEAAATRVAAEQRVPGETETIEWQDEGGAWHEEVESGSDRPAAYVQGAVAAQSAPPARRQPALPRDNGGPLLIALLLAGTVGVLFAMLNARRSEG